MSEKIKYIDPREFRELGFLQEANRQFFHPLGLALQVDTGSGEMKVWDYREDEEGIVFADGVISRAKAYSVSRERQRHQAARTRMFGHTSGSERRCVETPGVIQPLP